MTYGDPWPGLLESCWEGPNTDGFVMWDEATDTQMPCEFTYPIPMEP